MLLRVLVTGSRDWDRVDIIEEALSPYTQSKMVLVSGHCPTGADKIAETIWTGWGGELELHPADWAKHGKKAGFLRNAEMVGAGAFICLAFIRNGSKGAAMTRDLADKAGITTYTFEENDAG